MTSRHGSSFFAAVAVSATVVLFAPACILDFDGLAGGETRGSGGSGGSGSGSGNGSGSGGAGDGTCPDGPVLDCAGCPTDCPTEGCSPKVLASGNPAAVVPMGIATADGALYWVNQEAGNVARIVESGEPEIIATTKSPMAIAAAGGRVVWSAEDGLWGCPADTCDAQKTLLANPLGPGTIQGVAFDGSTVFWTDRGTDVNNGNGKASRCSFDAACADAVDIGTDLLFPQGITLSVDSVFWTVQGTGDMNGRVFKAPRAGGSGDAFAAALSLPTSIAADTTYAYWTESTANGKVLRCPHTQGYCDMPEEVAPAADPLATPVDIAIGGGLVYFSTAGDGSIRSCPLAGCGAGQPVVYTSGRQGLHRLALSTTCLFWTDDAAGGSVLKIARQKP